ncbi:hypothetical protein KCU65_g282, partial [Aureobasidium melanogenum]
MTSSALSNSRIAKHQITHKSTHSNRQHDPTIISHEEQPSIITFFLVDFDSSCRLAKGKVFSSAEVLTRHIINLPLYFSLITTRDFAHEFVAGDIVEVMRQDLKTMQRLVVSQVKSICIPSCGQLLGCLGLLVLMGWVGEGGEPYVHVAHVAVIHTAMIHTAVTHVAVVHVEEKPRVRGSIL